MYIDEFAYTLVDSSERKNLSLFRTLPCAEIFLVTLDREPKVSKMRNEEQNTKTKNTKYFLCAKSACDAQYGCNLAVDGRPFVGR